MSRFLRNSSLICYMQCRKMSNTIQIDVKQGSVIGEKKQLQNGHSFYCFKGIPYAKSPIGDLRFKAPQPLLKFDKDVLDCTHERDVSFHKDPFTSDLVGSEDCLFLNVYTPKLKSETPLPVMVWIHGGAFLMGSGNSDFFYPRFLMDEGVVVVTLNYRLGMFGFLCYPKSGILGNAGLKDQVMALKWVKANIEQFNGDPNNVTLFGQSAGAAAIHLHLLSEISKKYFDKAIVQSGSAINEWVIQNNPEYKAKRLAELMGFKGPDDKLVEFLIKTKQPVDIYKHLLGVLTPDERRRGLPMPFKPVVEIPSSEAIITKRPIDLLKRNDSIDKPVMMGYTSAEGITMLANAIKKLDTIDSDLASLIPRSVNLEPNDPNCLTLATEMRKFYFNNQKIDSKSLESLKDLLTDYHFTIGLQAVAEIHSRYNCKSPLFFYKFSYVGGLNMFKKWFQLEKLKGACHGDDLFYLFQMANLEDTLNPGANDKKIVKVICKLWTNFAKYSNPTPNEDDSLKFKWKPVKNIKNNEKFTLDYLNIDNEIQMKQDPDKERIQFWRDIYQTWNKDFLRPKL
ncbi:juvenile hormone esterase-like [Condylostylus longicornis]|uniref:juvenile hormone esterase-like n=1 Tax=Condylostylus longicornis TaxID=2530218 RepID=UPI00244DA402|nr:juvenile hormone esterase-like [Condylostylus longicornis]